MATVRQLGGPLSNPIVEIAGKTHWVPTSETPLEPGAFDVAASVLGSYAPTRGYLQPERYYRAYHTGWTTTLSGIDVHPDRLYITPSQLGGRGSIDRIMIHIVSNGDDQQLRVGYYLEEPDCSLTLHTDFGVINLGTDDDTDLALAVDPVWGIPPGPAWWGVLNASASYATLGAYGGSPAYQDLFGMIESYHANGSGNRWYDAGGSALPTTVPPADNEDWNMDGSGYSESVPFIVVRGALAS